MVHIPLKVCYHKEHLGKGTVLELSRTDLHIGEESDEMSMPHAKSSVLCTDLTSKRRCFPDLTLAVMAQSKKHYLSISQQLLLSPQVQKKRKIFVFKPLLPLHLHY